jgi:hypothetical protein
MLETIETSSYDGSSLGSHSTSIHGLLPEDPAPVHAMGALGTAELDELSTDDAIEVGFTPRSYQREMLEESMKGNVIIAVSLPESG